MNMAAPDNKNFVMHLDYVNVCEEHEYEQNNFLHTMDVIQILNRISCD